MTGIRVVVTSIRKLPQYQDMTPYHAVECVEGFGDGDGASESEVLAAWQYIADTGMWKHFQGFYGRTVHDLIESGQISKPYGYGENDEQLLQTQ